jgi:radical SAM superfamily enzyme YgiQ (UPF0313 family)
MLRVTRNCPWNRCRFCNLYKNTKFSIRRTEHTLADIDSIAEAHGRLISLDSLRGSEREAALADFDRFVSELNDDGAVESALHWYSNGCRSVFLQDANALIMKTEDLTAILRRLKERFPSVERVTSYARSKTVLGKSVEELVALKEAGLSRIHIGMESGSDHVLAQMEKGATKAEHIAAGQRVKEAGIELSEYYILGLGGMEWQRGHALESADAMNRINPDFIRVRTLSVVGRSPLGEDVRAGRFVQPNDLRCAEELALFIENLTARSYLINNDHIVNLLPEATGQMPEDKERMLEAVNWFLSLPTEEQTIYRVGRRMLGIGGRKDFEEPSVRAMILDKIVRHGVTQDNVDEIMERVLRGYI